MSSAPLVIQTLVVLLNITELVILIKKRCNKNFSPSDAILTSLCSSDLIFGINGVINNSISRLFKSQGINISKIQIISFQFTTALTILNVVLLTADRLIAIRFPLKYRIWLNMKTISIAVAIIWILSIGFTLLPYFVPKLFGYSTNNILMALVLPTACFIGVCYACIYHRIRTQRRKIVHFTDKLELSGTLGHNKSGYKNHSKRNSVEMRDYNLQFSKLGCSERQQHSSRGNSDMTDWNVASASKQNEKRISKNARSNLRRKNRRHLSKADRSERKVMRIGIAIVVLFMICYLPATFLFLIFTVPTAETLKYFIVSFALISLNSVGNPIIYFLCQYKGRNHCCPQRTRENKTVFDSSTRSVQISTTFVSHAETAIGVVSVAVTQQK